MKTDPCYIPIPVLCWNLMTRLSAEFLKQTWRKAGPSRYSIWLPMAQRGNYAFTMIQTLLLVLSANSIWPTDNTVLVILVFGDDISVVVYHRSYPLIPLMTMPWIKYL